MVKSLHLHLLFFGWLLPVLASGQIRVRERIQLATGEVLIGEVLAEDGRTLTFRSEGLGTLTIPLTPDLRRTPLEASAASPAQQGVAPSAMVVAPTPESTEPSGPPSTWKRRVEAGFSLQQRGNSDSNYAGSIRAEVTRKAGPNAFRAHFRYLLADQNNERSTDRFDAGVALRHDFFERFYLRGDLFYRFDRLRDYSNDFEGSLGWAYYFWKNERFKLWFGPGLALNYSEPEGRDSGFRWLGDIHTGLDLALGSHLRFEHRGICLFRFEDFNDYRLRFDEALKALLNERITLGLRYEYEYESILPFEDGRGEHRLFSTVELKY